MANIFRHSFNHLNYATSTITNRPDFLPLSEVCWEHLSFAFTVRASPLAYCTIRERGRSHYNKKNAFYKTEMLPVCFMPTRNVAILMFDDVEVLEFATFFEVFSVRSELNKVDSLPLGMVNCIICAIVGAGFTNNLCLKQTIS